LPELSITNAVPADVSVAITTPVFAPVAPANPVFAPVPDDVATFAPVVAPTLPVVPEETSVTPRSANVDGLFVSVKPDAVKSLTTSTLD